MNENLEAIKIPAHLYQIAIGEALGRLPLLERNAVALRYLKDLTVAEVATRMGMSWDGADALIGRGVSAVNRYLKGSRFEYHGPPARVARVALPEASAEALEEIFDNLYIPVGGESCR